MYVFLFDETVKACTPKFLEDGFLKEKKTPSLLLDLSGKSSPAEVSVLSNSFSATALLT